ncbi:hypothetical protein TNCV_1108041 [Trichonephila clavipes]|nr:hypothetical protein TNCV_1108041 [Trichonephila clavipes]
MRTSLRFNKFITTKTVESGLWTLQAPWQLLNIANIQSRSWSGTEFAQVAKHIWCLWKRTLKSIRKCTRGTFLKLYFRGPKGILEMQIGRFNKTTPAQKAKKTQEWCKANFPGMISSEQWPPYTPDLNTMVYGPF